MPKFNREPEEEKKLGFKVEDKRRIDLEKIDKEIKEEKEKKRFDAMTPEQREEWEYNRDKERGFSIRDKRPIFDRIGELKPKQEDQEKIEEIKERIDSISPEPKPEPEIEKSPVGATPEIYDWKERLDGFKNELQKIENDFKSAKFGGRTILGFAQVSNELKIFQEKFDKYAENELPKADANRRSVLIDEFSKISQKIADMKDAIGGKDKKIGVHGKAEIGVKKASRSVFSKVKGYFKKR